MWLNYTKPGGTRFPVNWYHGAGSAIVPSNCWTPLIVLPDGGYGHDDGQVEDNGTLVPQYTSDNIYIYSFRFYTDGTWLLQFGIAGDEQLPNSSQGVIQFDIDDAENILLVWNAANSRYEGTDEATALKVIELVGEEVCFAGGIVPENLIWYDFAVLQVKNLAEATATTVDRVFNWIKGF